MYKWKVVPLCKEQLLDIKPEDVIPGGIFRTCDVYKSGGGYDKFPEICKNRLGRETSPKQFVVQLYGCHLKCPYCYVTENGVWGKPILYSLEELLNAFYTSGCEVFHLMGGSPALYLNYWSNIIDNLPFRYVFHSDLLLTEGYYNEDTLKAISMPNCLYAVNIKGVTPEDYERNTRCKLDDHMFWHNFDKIVEVGVPFYLTFTNPRMIFYDEFIEKLKYMYGNEIMKDSFIIDLIEYDATKAYTKEN